MFTTSIEHTIFNMARTAPAFFQQLLLRQTLIWYQNQQVTKLVCKDVNTARVNFFVILIGMTQRLFMIHNSKGICVDFDIKVASLMCPRYR